MQVAYYTHISRNISVLIYGETFMLTIHWICEESVSKLEN